MLDRQWPDGLMQSEHVRTLKIGVGLFYDATQKTRTKNVQWVKWKITIFAEEKKRLRVKFWNPAPGSQDKESHQNPRPP